MSRFRVLINGENFLSNFERQLQKLGFYVTLTVDAASIHEAEILAIDLIKQDSSLKGNAHNQPDDPPILYVDEIEEIPSNNSRNIFNTGFSWYPHNE